MDADEVDRLVSAWQRERPDVDVAPLEVLSRVSRLSRHLDLARRSAFGRHGLEPWEFDVLAALRREGEPAPGRFRREPDPVDRRGVHAVLTPEGRAVVDAALDDLLDQEREILASLSESDRDRLAQLLRAIVTPFDNPPE